MTHLRVILRLSSDDASELEAQALNNDSRLKEAGITALKFASNYHTAGNISQKFSSPEAGDVPAWGMDPGVDLHVFVRITNEDAYKLKSQALNENPLLNKAGISDVRLPGENQNLGENNQTVLSLKIPKTQFERPRLPGTDLIVTLRMTERDAYQLTASGLNDDPRLRKSGITTVKLNKGEVVPLRNVPNPPHPVPVAPPKKRRFVGCLTATLLLCLGGVVLTGLAAAGVYFFVPNLTINLADPIATTAVVVPVESASTTTPYTLVPATTAASLTPAILLKTPTQPSTATMTATASQTPGLSCQPAQGVVNVDQLSCRYGPGASYLYRSGLFLGDNVDVLGKADTAYGTWLYLLSQSGVKCWVNSKYVDVDQDLACLESYYPDKASLIIFPTALFPAPSNIETERSGTNVSIYWTGYNLAIADRESATSPRYLLELWTCQGGKIVFTPLGTSDEFADILDEPGCSKPSHGQIFLAHKSGYIGPSIIPWP